MDIMVVFQTMLKLFLLLILGFVLFKCHIFDEYTNKIISFLPVYHNKKIVIKGVIPNYYNLLIILTKININLSLFSLILKIKYLNQ